MSTNREARWDFKTENNSTCQLKYIAELHSCLSMTKGSKRLYSGHIRDNKIIQSLEKGSEKKC